MSAAWMIAGMLASADAPAATPLPPGPAPALAPHQHAGVDCPHCGGRVPWPPTEAPKPSRFRRTPSSAVLPPSHFPAGIAALPMHGPQWQTAPQVVPATNLPAPPAPAARWAVATQTAAPPVNAGPQWSGGSVAVAPPALPRFGNAGSVGMLPDLRPANVVPASVALGTPSLPPMANAAPIPSLPLPPMELLPIPAAPPPAAAPKAAGISLSRAADAWTTRPAMPAAGSATHRGTLHRAGTDGAWLLRTDTGATYRLHAPASPALIERGAVEVAGTLQPPGPRDALPTLVAERLATIPR